MEGYSQSNISPPKTHRLAIFFVFFLIAFIVISGIYLLWSSLAKKSLNVSQKQIVQPYSRRFILEAYTLLPNFQNGQYESRVVINGQTYPPLSSSGLRWNSTSNSIVTPTGDTTFPYFLTENQKIQYTIYDILSGMIVLSASYVINSDDMSSANTIYLCDGAIVSNLQFVTNFQYRFDRSWESGTCETQTYAVLSWNTSSINNVITDDSIVCSNPPETNTTPYTYNSSGLTSTMVGWKGAWVGMTWYVNLGSVEGNNIGSVTLLSPSNPILVIAPGNLSMSSS